jgi:peptidyl-prolyl cis-trans isomerase C
MNHLTLARTAAPLLLLALVQGPVLAAEETVLATVNGTSLTAADVERYRDRRPESDGTPEVLLQELINLELLVQDATRAKLDQGEEYKRELEMTRRALLAQFAVRNQVESNPVDEARMREVYEQQIGQAGGEPEYRARHILVDSEADAKAVIAELDGGADFAELAKTRSTGPSGPQGGDLGWFSAGQMVPEFSQATATLEAGSYSKAPVQTQFGWHVILLEETRQASGPSFEEVRPQIENMLQSMQVREYIEGLRTKAEIKVN